MKTLVTTMLLCLICIGIRAQELRPTDLFQVYKYWQMHVKDYDRNTYEYVRTIDSHWDLRMTPQRENNSFMVLLGYFIDNKWYRDEQYRLMLTYDPSKRSPKAVMYSFTNSETWNQYNKQMGLMNAVSLMTTHNGGGTQWIYQVNDIVIYLSEFPPGINGADRTYQVILTHA